MNNGTTSIIKEYYHTIAMLLAYEPTEQTVKLEKEILTLLCRIKNNEQAINECWEHIEDSRCLQICSDESLIRSLPSASMNTVLDLKMDVLEANNIERLKGFDEWVFTEELKDLADIGNKHACKLLACLHRLGLILPGNKEVAFSIWSALAVNGDWTAIEAMIHFSKEDGLTDQFNKWTHILRILQTEYESFSSVALKSKYPDYTEDEVQFANLIMFIRQKNSKIDSRRIDRPMLHYILESKENFGYKMERLSGETNYYMVMNMEDRYSGKKYGF